MLNVRYILTFVFIRAVSSVTYIDYPQSIQSHCNEGEVIKNKCIRCICSRNMYHCSSIVCNNFTVSEESKESVPEQQTICHANMIYKLNSTICICNKNGLWPNTECSNIFKSLPANNASKPYCEPNSYVIIDCNVCRCGPLGEVQKDYCTDNVCSNKTESKGRRSNKSTKIYGSCEENNWYSMAPCQLCFCVKKNKLVCNTGHNYSKKVKLGSYNLNVCGKELISEAMELIPKKQELLRHGERNAINTDSPTIVKSKTDSKQYVIVDQSHDVSIERDTKTNKSPNKKYNNQHDSESDEDSQEIVTVKTIDSEELRTQLPYNDDEPDSSRNDFENIKKEVFEQEDNSDNETGVGIEEQTSKSLETQAEKDTEPESETQLDSLKNLGHSLSANLPKVLSKVFKMALRKSMVSLSNDSNCEPGTTTRIKCNTCFCMKNHKLLCTKNECN